MRLIDDRPRGQSARLEIHCTTVAVGALGQVFESKLLMKLNWRLIWKEKVRFIYLDWQWKGSEEGKSKKESLTGTASDSNLLNLEVLLKAGFER